MYFDKRQPLNHLHMCSHHLLGLYIILINRTTALCFVMWWIHLPE